MEPHVDARADQIADKRTRKESREPRELRIARPNRDNATLIVAFVVRKKERPLFPDRPAEGGAELVSLEEWVGVEGVAAEARIGRKVMVSIEREAIAMSLVATGARHDVQRGNRCRAGRQVEVHGRHLEFLNDLLRDLKTAANRSGWMDARAIHSSPGEADARNRLHTSAQ
jgi:hypothetical protein